MVDETAPPTERPLKSDMVEQRLLAMIETGELAPGAPLHQRAIAQQFGVSPTPVREALRRLEMAGLVVTSSQSGTRVAASTEPADPDGAAVRTALEQLGIELAVGRATPADIAELRRLNDAYAQAEDAVEAREWHRRLHFHIFEIAGSPILLSQVRVLWGMLEVGRATKRERAASAAHHGALIDAIAAGDAATAKALLHEHHTPPDEV